MGTLREILRAYRYTSSKHWEQFNELERLAKIGKATEKWFSMENSYQNQEIDGFFNSCQELLEWAEKED